MSALPSPDPEFRSRNLKAIAEAAPALHDQLLRAVEPPDVQCTTARDGRLTYRWTDGEGRTAWLGRTTLPSVRGAALAEVFQPGSGNVAVVQAGHGCLLQVLLDRLHALQAVFVVETETAQLGMLLRLHDFSAKIAAGRLCLFAGEAAWDDLAAFLMSSSGYLVPDRIVNWPWFTPRDIAEVSGRLQRITNEVAAHRLEAIEHARRSSHRHDVKLLILAPESGGGGARLAHGLIDAGRRQEWSAASMVVDRPANRDASLLSRVMIETNAEWTIIVDGSRARLPAPLPDETRALTWLTDSAHLTEALIAGMAPHDRLIVPHQAALEQAAALGMDKARVRCVPPGAHSASLFVEQLKPIEVQARDVGLVLASHAAIWDAALTRRERTLTPWSDDQAEPLLRQAESDSGAHLTSDEVRTAILERMKVVLGPGVEFNAYQCVWREFFPVEDGRAQLLLPVQGRVDSVLLDAAARGSVLFIRSHPGEKAVDGWPAFVDRALVNTFSSPSQLRELLRQFRSDPSAFVSRAAAAKEQVLARHTWVNRLVSALGN